MRAVRMVLFASMSEHVCQKPYEHEHVGAILGSTDRPSMRASEEKGIY